MVKIETIAQMYNLSYAAKDKVAYGDVNGIVYSLTPTENANFATLETSVNTDANGKRNEITDELSAKKKELKKVVNSVVVSPYTIKMQVNISTMPRVEMLRDVFAAIKGIVDSYSLNACCSLCGESKPTKTYYAGANASSVCDSCAVDIINKTEEAEAENRGKKGNVVAGIVGAFLGALLGGVLWIIMYQFGYIVAIVALVCVVCAHKGYTIFSGKKDIKAAVIAVIISIVVIFLAHYLCWSIEILKVYGPDYGISIFDAIASTHLFVFDPEVITDFFGDLIIGYIFMAVGAFSFIKNAIQNPMGSVHFKLLEDNDAAMQ